MSIPSRLDCDSVHATPAPADRSAVLQVCDEILSHARAVDFAGHDPYDGLATSLWPAQPLLRSKVSRLLLTQIVRRSPVDLRPFLRIPPLTNPKTIALLMSTCAELYEQTRDGRYRDAFHAMSRRVLEIASPGWSGTCWGYPFSWQARSFYLPKGTPTVVCTSFVAQAFLDGFRAFAESRYLATARSAAEFMVHDLKRTPTPGGFTFSYSPLDESVIHNASALGASILQQTGALLSHEQSLGLADKAFIALLGHQRENGSWPYGAARHHQWVDGFHTGYILEALHRRSLHGAPERIVEALDRGLEFYWRHLLVDGWRPVNRLGDRTSSFEMHAAAEALVVLSKLGARLPGSAAGIQRLVDLILASRVQTERFFPNTWPPRGFQRLDGPTFLRWTIAWVARGLGATIRYTPVCSRPPAAGGAGRTSAHGV